MWPPRLTPVTPNPRTGAGRYSGRTSARLLERKGAQRWVSIAQGNAERGEAGGCAEPEYERRRTPPSPYRTSAAVPHCVEYMSIRCVGFDQPRFWRMSCSRWPWLRWSSATTTVPGAAAAIAAHSSPTSYELPASPRRAARCVRQFRCPAAAIRELQLGMCARHGPSRPCVTNTTKTGVLGFAVPFQTRVRPSESAPARRFSAGPAP